MSEKNMDNRKSERQLGELETCNKCEGGCKDSIESLLTNGKHEFAEMRHSNSYVTPDSEDDTYLGQKEIETQGFMDDIEENSCFNDEEISEVMEVEISEKVEIVDANASRAYIDSTF